MTCFAAKQLKFDSPQRKPSRQRLSCLHVSVRSAHLLFFSIFSNIPRSVTGLQLQKFFLTSCAEYFVASKTNQVGKQLPILHVNIRLK